MRRSVLGRVNLMAFEMRLNQTCRRRVGSPMASGRSSILQ